MKNFLQVARFFAFLIVVMAFGYTNSYSQAIVWINFKSNVNGRMDAFEIPVKANFKNNTNENMQVLCKMTVQNLSGPDGRDDFGNFIGHSATFCWGDVNDPINPGTCYAATRSELVASPEVNTLTIAANETSMESWFTGYLYPAGLEGQSCVSYTVFNVNNENESSTFQVCFNITPTSVESELIGSIYLFPNPTNSELNIKIENDNLPNSIKVLNSNGEIVFERNINNQSDLNIETNNLSNGKYFYQLVGGNLNNNTIPFVVNK